MLNILFTRCEEVYRACTQMIITPRIIPLLGCAVEQNK
ncbi:predicted protein [Sclerotinia sclerotiorum 1980 UF-70]|uniref:Uncharacterized protein n=1 Tax=Sclerotinia sclerotiorum (strain ATCC 18683 / 1980 / Ss-1) TaxID=665079 RepID=A7F5Z8_SCLS1|nr:predicted protein [Sclerotinia sclerotiorum 1980 UF-70]EDN98169.1 predicted protein [Sclerotinia sclerotiorum 1980 UF-70]